MDPNGIPDWLELTAAIATIAAAVITVAAVAIALYAAWHGKNAAEAGRDAAHEANEATQLAKDAAAIQAREGQRERLAAVLDLLAEFAVPTPGWSRQDIEQRRRAIRLRLRGLVTDQRDLPTATAIAFGQEESLPELVSGLAPPESLLGEASSEALQELRALAESAAAPTPRAGEAEPGDGQ
jgi:hypothetical protein